MKLFHALLPVILTLLVFLALEALCVFSVSNNSIVQSFIILGKARNVQSAIWEKNTNIKSFFNLKKTNDILWRQNYKLFRQAMIYREQLSANQQDTILNGFLQSYFRADSVLNEDSIKVQIINHSGIKEQFDFLTAKIIKNSIGTLHNYIIIDKGSADGIKEDMGVITPFGVVGIIRAVGRHNSYVLSFLNSKQKVSAKVGKTDAFGPMSWDKNSTTTAILNEIPPHIKFKKGDTIYTSGMSAFYPPDIPLGTVKKSKIINGIHHSITVSLFQNPNELKEVIVVKNNNRNEIDSLTVAASTKI